MKHYLGISAGFHDAAAAVVREDGEILFAGHSERYSKRKNDAHIHSGLIRDLDAWQYDVVAFYERPWLHNVQQWVSGQREWGAWTVQGALRQQLGDWVDRIPRQRGYGHHLSHAAAGFQTSPFREATVVVIDAIGELDTISIYRAWYDESGRAQYRRLWRSGYPHSIGLFYSAATQRCGLRAQEEEYITMGMAAYGTPRWQLDMRQALITHDHDRVLFRENLHTGWPQDLLRDATAEDIAASAQQLTQDMVLDIMRLARTVSDSRNLVYMGGVALNCVINSQLGRIWDDVWIMPNPGDAGSSLGAAALAHGGPLHWRTAFLGHSIAGEYPVRALLHELEQAGMVGVASGRAEFGPRALGNRSLLADPRGAEIKDKVNDIKRRQRFRPFAPVILEEHVHDYFAMPSGWNHSRYMQVVADCRRPDLYPAICHVDNTSRVQTVAQDGSGIRRLLEAWYQRTGCAMLLNTSLNIRGEPMVNDRVDAARFTRLYGVRVLG